MSDQRKKAAQTMRLERVIADALRAQMHLNFCLDEIDEIVYIGEELNEHIVDIVGEETEVTSDMIREVENRILRITEESDERVRRALVTLSQITVVGANE